MRRLTTAIVMRMDWPDATAEQYDELRKVVNWEQDKADGGLFHVAAFDESGAHITDVWESVEQFQRFTDERLMPRVQKVGIAGEPQVIVLSSHPATSRASHRPYRSQTPQTRPVCCLAPPRPTL